MKHEPRCSACGWTLEFVPIEVPVLNSHGGLEWQWVARCWNRDKTMRRANGRTVTQPGCPEADKPVDPAGTLR